MDPSENIGRIKDNLFLIPAARFDSLVQDKGYADSFIYYVACIILSVPFTLLAAYLTNSLVGTIMIIPVSVILSVVLAYVVFGIQHVLLRLVGGKGTFLQSVQLFIYGSTPSIIFGTIPLVNVLSSLVGLANVVVGAERVHRISLLRAIVAIVVIPAILFVAALAALLLLSGAVTY